MDPNLQTNEPRRDRTENARATLARRVADLARRVRERGQVTQTIAVARLRSRNRSIYAVRGPSLRARAALVSIALAGAALVASHPELFSDLFMRAFLRDFVLGPQLPLTALVENAESASAAGKSREVAAWCGEIVRGYPEHPVAEPAHVRMVQAHMANGEGVAAERALLEFRRHHPDSELLSEILLDVARWQYDQGAFSTAAQTWTDLIAAVTRSGTGGAREDAAPRPVIVRSLSLWKELQREERSRTELERLARFNQALSWERAGDIEAALRSFDRFVARFPQDRRVPEARFRMASLLLGRGETEIALQSFQQVARDTTAATSFRSESIYRAGRCEETLRRLDAAAQTYAQAIDLVPADNHFRLASLAALAQLVESREPTRALALYRELVNTSTETAVRAVALQRLARLEADMPPASTSR